jgi:uncharacterized protein (DUF433 family)
MGRNSGSDVRDAGTISRSSSPFSGRTREESLHGTGRSDGFRAADGFAGGRPFEAFAEAIHQELDPRSRLEHVLADRVVLSAWALHAAGEQELDAIRDRTPVEAGADATSPRDVLVAVQCLAGSLDSLLRLREMAQPGRERPESCDEPATAPITWAEAIDMAGDGSADLEELDPYDTSNEWPVVPRGRQVTEAPEAEAPAGRPEEKPALAECWQDRLVFDFNVSDSSPVVKGTWVTVGHVLSLIVDGWTWSDILRTHPELNVDDIRTCLAYTVAESNGDN